MHCGPEVLFETCVTMKFVDDGDDDVTSRSLLHMTGGSRFSFCKPCTSNNILLWRIISCAECNFYV